MTTKQPTKYTVVQHSAYVAKDNPQFQFGLESAALTTKREINKVEAVGGRLFDTYAEAEDFAEAEMYPEGLGGLIPRARGSFTHTALARIDGKPIYIPAPPPRHDDNGKAYVAYFRQDVTTGFIWTGNDNDEVQVTREMGEPIIDTFKLTGGGAPSSLRDFKAQCDRWLEER